MWNKPTVKQLEKIPALYSTEKIPLEEKKVYMHFFFGGCDWWVIEYSPEDRLFYGYVCLGDSQCAEWGLFSIDDLISIRKGFVEIDRDKHWKITKVKDVKEIKKEM